MSKIRFLITVTGKDESPIGYSNMMIDANSLEDAKTIALKTVSEFMGFPENFYTVSGRQKE